MNRFIFVGNRIKKFKNMWHRNLEEGFGLWHILTFLKKVFMFNTESIRFD